jgi:hypothetical protein
VALTQRPSPAWEVADRLKQRLLVVPNPLAAWNSDPFWISVQDSDSRGVLVSLSVPRESADPFIQLAIRFEMTEECPETQAERIVTALKRPHPLAGAVVSAGYRECAEDYGYAWPPTLNE